MVATTLALAWVAAGRRAACVTDGDLRDSVHLAAGIALCRAAGRTATGLHGRPLRTGVVGLIAAADEGTHAALVEMAANRTRRPEEMPRCVQRPERRTSAGGPVVLPV